MIACRVRHFLCSIFAYKWLRWLQKRQSTSNWLIIFRSLSWVANFDITFLILFSMSQTSLYGGSIYDCAPCCRGMERGVYDVLFNYLCSCVEARIQVEHPRKFSKKRAEVRFWSSWFSGVHALRNTVLLVHICLRFLENIIGVALVFESGWIIFLFFLPRYFYIPSQNGIYLS